MTTFNDDYLKINFDKFEFFDPECHDRRVREVNMRTKRCLGCPGITDCRRHPEFWLQGLEARELASQES